MTPEQEIARIKRDYKEHWARLEKIPRIQQAVAENNPIKLGEIAAEIVHGNIWKPTKEELSQGQSDYKDFLAYKERERLIEQKKKNSNRPCAFQIHANDNVATLLDDATVGEIEILGAQPQKIELPEKIERGHKIALRDIAPNEAVIKFGVRIGHATKPIQRGAWVHLHNLASDLDYRSGTLDLHSGAPTDTNSAYV